MSIIQEEKLRHLCLTLDDLTNLDVFGRGSYVLCTKQLCPNKGSSFTIGSTGAKRECQTKGYSAHCDWVSREGVDRKTGHRDRWTRRSGYNGLRVPSRTRNHTYHLDRRAFRLPYGGVLQRGEHGTTRLSLLGERT